MKEESEELRVRLGAKVRSCEELQSKLNRQQNDVEIQIASATEKFLREINEKDDEINEITSEMSLKLSSTYKNLEMKNSDLKEAEDRIQELETQLSDTESKSEKLSSKIKDHNASIQSYEEKLQESNNIQASLKSTIDSITRDCNELKSKLLKTEDQGSQLREMLAANELEIDQLKSNSSTLATKEKVLQEEMNKNNRLTLTLEEKDNKILSLEEDLSVLQKDLQQSKVDASGMIKALNEQLEEVKVTHEKEIDEIKEKEAESRTILMNSHRKALDSVKNDQEILLKRAADEFETKSEELKKMTGLVYCYF